MGPILSFFALTYAITWACFMAAAALPDSGAAALRWPLLILGSFAPSSVALWLTWRESGRAGARALLARLLEWRIGVRWYAFALFYMATIKLGVAGVYRIAMGTWPRFGPEPWYAYFAALLFASILGGPLGEELGWRGYALPRLADRMGLSRASLLLGVVWACWHLPLFFMPGLDKSGQSFPVYVLQVTALSVALAWLYAHTRGSLLLAVLMHGAINQAKDIVPSTVSTATNPWAPSHSLVAWLTVGLLWACGVWFLARMSRATRQAPRRSITSTIAATLLLILALAVSAHDALAQTRKKTKSRRRGPRAEQYLAVDSITITGPTVLAYLVIPAGAVDTMPELAVATDDWSFGMATLGDSLRKRGYTFGLVTQSKLRLEGSSAEPLLLKLGDLGSAGYVFARPGEAPCLRRRGAGNDSTVVAAGEWFADGSLADRRKKLHCEGY